MKRSARRGLRRIFFTILLFTFLIGSFAIANSEVLDNDISTVSLNGKETKGITYFLKEVTKQDDQFIVTIVQQPNDADVTLIDSAVYNDSNSESQEWKDALVFGNHLVGSSCNVKLLLPNENKTLSSELEEGSREGASITTAFRFDTSEPIDLNNAVLIVDIAFFESPDQVITTNATLTMY